MAMSAAFDDEFYMGVRWSCCENGDHHLMMGLTRCKMMAGLRPIRMVSLVFCNVREVRTLMSCYSEWNNQESAVASKLNGLVCYLGYAPAVSMYIH